MKPIGISEDGKIMEIGEEGVDLNSANFLVLTQTQIDNLPSSLLNSGRAIMVANVTTATLQIYYGGTWYDFIGEPVPVIDFSDDFEGSSSWTLVNDSTNKWIVGSADSVSGSQSMYISDNGTDATYSNTSNVSHAYIDILIPSSASRAIVRFMLRIVAEAGYDYFRLYIAPTSVTPTAGNEVSSSYAVSDEITDEPNWIKKEFDVPSSFIGTTARFILSWHNDGSVTHQPPSMIDDFLIGHFD